MPSWTAVTRVLICALMGAVSAVAQEGRAGLISFRRIAIPEDVPAHLCSAIAQDATGLLWFGTQGGLVRYDGYELRVYRSNPADPTTLAGSYVRALLVASDGRLWVGTFSGGLSVFDPRTEKFTRFQVAYDRVEGQIGRASCRERIGHGLAQPCVNPDRQRVPATVTPDQGP